MKNLNSILHLSHEFRKVTFWKLDNLQGLQNLPFSAYDEYYEANGRMRADQLLHFSGSGANLAGGGSIAAALRGEGHR